MHKCANHVLRYLQSTTRLRLLYTRGRYVTIMEYSDSIWGQQISDRKSIGAYIFIFSNAAINWRRNNKDIVDQSTVEAGFIALPFAIKETLWFKTFNTTTRVPSKTFNICIEEDNQGCISLAKDSKTTDFSKHIDVKYQLIVDKIRKKQFRLHHITYKPTSEMVAEV